MEVEGRGGLAAKPVQITKVSLFTADREFQRLCREILEEILGESLRLSAYDSAAPPPDAALYIWDYQLGPPLPVSLVREEPHKHVFLLQRQHLPALRQEIGLDELHVLLKPATRGALRALFEHVSANRTEADRKELDREGSLRADRDAMLQGLIQANLNLQVYDQERTNFLARALHDFRVPLTAISGYCGLLVDEQFGSLKEEQRDVVIRMQHSVKRLSQMASAMFQLSSWQRVEHRPDLAVGDIRETIDQAMHEIALMADEKHISVSLDLTPPAVPLTYELLAVEQVLVNLLENACKFSPRGGGIAISGYPYFWERRASFSLGPSAGMEKRRAEQRTPNAFRIDIRDSGPGVPPHHLGDIFEEYTSYSGGSDRSGGGLGLAICRMLINRQQGRIWAENQPEGAMFSFVLPYKRADLRHRLAPPPFAPGRNGERA